MAKEEEIRTTESQFWDFELDAKKEKVWMDMAHCGRWRQGVSMGCFAAPSQALVM